MPLKNQPLGPFQAILVISGLLVLSAVGYGVFLGLDHLLHQRRVEAAIPRYVEALKGDIHSLSGAIENYHSQFGFYPPSPSTNLVQRALLNPLYYELVGTRWNTNDQAFGVPTAKEMIKPDVMKRLFNMTSFSNTLIFPAWPTNFIDGLRFAGREERDVFLIGSSAPDEIGPDLDREFTVSAWRYATAPAEHNRGKFDLWIELDVLGRHFVVNNW